MKIYNQLSDEYNELYFQNVSKFIDSIRENNPEPNYFVNFYPSFGIKKNEPCEFLIVGQAVNGWRSGCSTEEKLEAKSIVENAISASNSFFERDNHSPLDWVNIHWTKSLLASHREDDEKANFYNTGDYVAYRSFFWKVTYKLINDYYKRDRESWDWSKKIVWSNLYKIAPEDSNPDEFQKNIQIDLSIKLLQKEIQELNPKYCIVITNKSWWEPFKKSICDVEFEIDETLNEIEFHSKFMNTHIIVTTRPFLGNGDLHVQQLLELINKNV
jgi:hypothetical protein